MSDSRVTYPRCGNVYWAFNATPESNEWCTVRGSYYGARVDPPAPSSCMGALFTTAEAAKAYRATAAPGTARDSDDPLVRVMYLGGATFPILGSEATA